MSDIELLRPLNHIGTNTIKTARLVLRRFQFSDHTDMFQWASDPNFKELLSAILLSLRKTMSVLPVISDGKSINHIGIKG